MSVMDWFRRLAGGAVEAAPAEVHEPPPEVAGLNFMTAIKVHDQWKAKLEASLQGADRPALTDVASETACTLGQWIYGPGGEAFGNLDSFAELRREHAQFHRHAGRVLAEARAGRADMAASILRGDYRHSSDRMKMLLAKLYVQLQEDGQ